MRGLETRGHGECGIGESIGAGSGGHGNTTGNVHIWIFSGNGYKLCNHVTYRLKNILPNMDVKNFG